MKTFALILACLLSACSQDILGLSPAQRLKLYDTTLRLTGNSSGALVVDEVGHIVLDKTSGK